METIFCLRDKTLTVELSGEIDHHVADRLRNDIDTEMQFYDAEHLVFDFSKVTFMDSSGIGVVLGRYKKVNAWGGTVIIQNASRLVKQILDMSGVFTLMDYVDTDEDK